MRHSLHSRSRQQFEPTLFCLLRSVCVVLQPTLHKPKSPSSAKARQEQGQEHATNPLHQSGIPICSMSAVLPINAAPELKRPQAENAIEGGAREGCIPHHADPLALASLHGGCPTAGNLHNFLGRGLLGIPVDNARPGERPRKTDGNCSMTHEENPGRRTSPAQVLLQDQSVPRELDLSLGTLWRALIWAQSRSPTKV